MTKCSIKVELLKSSASSFILKPLRGKHDVMHITAENQICMKRAVNIFRLSVRIYNNK